MVSRLTSFMAKLMHVTWSSLPFMFCERKEDAKCYLAPVDSWLRKVKTYISWQNAYLNLYLKKKLRNSADVPEITERLKCYSGYIQRHITLIRISSIWYRWHCDISTFSQFFQIRYKKSWLCGTRFGGKCNHVYNAFETPEIQYQL